MTETAEPEERLPENPLLQQLITAGAAESLIFWGYVGPPLIPGRVTLYPSLGNLSVSIDIGREDILHIEEVPETFMPFGAKVIWVKRTARIGRRFEQAAGVPFVKDSNFTQLRKGRLNMFLRAFQSPVLDDCSTPCNEDCHSSCSTCVSICQYTPPPPPPPPTTK
jgi:hypothetical protein